MSAFDNVVVGKLKLKGKALDVKGGAISKKKKKKQSAFDHQLSEASTGGEAVTDDAENEGGIGTMQAAASAYGHLTPAERRYLEQTERIQRQRLSKIARKSHRDRVQEFNQYLANLSEHYDIPKVGPG
ncbi:uncharacterized protein LOC126604338 [Malus sylvestris]|uniref:uncharacterized protein LOC126604338 n=1 Tax=Malus sylvestris TaxID=3752 RepID=UPI0021AC1BC6|nr:uncharacterized protein LOC126604338 [Malus sylvestris]